MPVDADLSNDFASIILETDQRKVYPSWGWFWRSSKNIWNILSIMLHITPWTLMLILYIIRQSIYLALINLYLLYFWCSTLHSIKSAQHCLYNSGKGWCTRYMYSIHVEQWYVCTLESHFCYFLWRKKILLTHLPKTDRFLISWTFQITSLLNLNENQC